MPEKKYVRYVGPHDAVDTYPAEAGGHVHCERGERVEVTPEQWKELTSESAPGWEDASGRHTAEKE